MTKKSNRQIKEELRVLHGAKCMLSNIESKDKSKMTLHHIQKVADGGPTTVENGCILYCQVHCWLHSLEHENKELYYLVNECLLLYKQCLDKDQVELIEQWEKEIQPKVKERVLENRRL